MMTTAPPTTAPATSSPTRKLLEAISVINRNLSLVSRYASKYGSACIELESDGHEKPQWYVDKFVKDQDLRLIQTEALVEAIEPLEHQLSKRTIDAMLKAFQHLWRHEDKLYRSLNCRFGGVRPQSRTELEQLETFCLYGKHGGHWPYRYWDSLVECLASAKNRKGKMTSPPKFEKADEKKKLALINDDDGLIRKRLDGFSNAAKEREKTYIGSCRNM